MMHCLRWLGGMAFAVVLSGTALAQNAALAPDALVKRTVDEVLAVIKQNRDKNTLRAIAEKTVILHFDFQTMTRLAVGKAWRDANPAQQKSLENAFRSLLVSTYTTALSQTSVADRVVEVRPLALKGGEDDVTVRTVVKESGKQPVAIDYRMQRSATGWKVYDVIVENLSLVTNYRGSFGTEISRAGIDGLIKTLEAKNRQLAEG